MKQFEIWLADLNPQIGTEPGKTRLVLVVQSDILNNAEHTSTVICPFTSKVDNELEVMRVNLSAGTSNLNQESAILIDQIRAIDNSRFIKKIGSLPSKLANTVKENLKIILDLE
jgi:mRNA interferase MazF